MMPRMRTIDQTAADMRERDPETAITKTALRRLVITGEIPSIRIGIKYLVDEDKVDELLSSGSIGQTMPAPIGVIRKVG